MSLEPDAIEDGIDVSNDVGTIYFLRFRRDVDIWMIALDEKTR